MKYSVLLSWLSVICTSMSCNCSNISLLIQIRAAVRVTDPQEVPYILVKPQLRIETFLINMERLRRIGMDVYDIWLYIKFVALQQL
jgi:hypothetical protein